MRRVFVVLSLLLARNALGGDYDDLGKFERETVDAALAERRMTIDAAPEGKIIGQVHVESLDVFAREDGFLRWFNHFHVITRPATIHREVLLHAGDVYSHALIDESLRNIRDPALHNVVVIVPVKSLEPGKVDLLVVTRDVWSLRFNTNYQSASTCKGDNCRNILTLLSLSLAENNLAGLREQLAFSFTMDQGAMAIGPSFADHNIAGTHLSLSTTFSTIFGRESGGYEGTSSETTFGYPLWSLATPWGATMTFYHYDSVYRQFRGADLDTLPLLGQDGKVADVPLEYRYRVVDLLTNVVRSFGTSKLKVNVSIGHQLYLTRPSFEDGFTQDPAIREVFERGVFPRNELSSSLYARYHLFTPVYGEYRDFSTYDLREDYALGPDADLVISTALKAIGSDHDFAGLSAAGSWSFDAGLNSYIKLGLSWKGRVQMDDLNVPKAVTFEGKETGSTVAHVRRGELSDSRVGASFYGASPKLWNTFRIIAEADLDTRLRSSANGDMIVGGDTGLRGYEIGQFKGHTSLVTHLELRTLPLRWLFFRLGGVLFWDMGHAAATIGDLDLHHDLGIGVRLLIPQLNTYVFRLDWAYPTEGQIPKTGRISLGFMQVF